MVDRQFSQKAVPISVIPNQMNGNKTPERGWISPEMETVEKEKEQKFQLSDNMPNMERMVLCLAELGGTAILVFMGCMGCSQGEDLPLEQIAITFGLAIMIGVQVFGHISGAHMNPAVTLAAVTFGDMPLIRVPLFLIGQLLGALAGYGLVKVLLVEFILTFILIWVCCAVWDDRNKKNVDSIALRLGFAVAGLALAGGPYSGAHMNPARSFGPALLDGKWNYQWVYWMGPIAGGITAALLYRIIFSKGSPSNNET